MTKNGSPVNPRTLNLPAREPVPSSQMVAFTALRDAYLARVHEALMDGLDNRTAVVAAPVKPTPMLHASVF
ncbi:MAG TPA: hypothetical protein VFX92_02485, partial [Candidatus Krumholzibacteria bacterium]|nr:hypothetical protein [Candidatus Krumholzibacteria bacterium]